MLKKIGLGGLVVAVTALLTPTVVNAYGAAHVGYTHVGPNGVYHTGATAASGPGGTYSGSHTSAYGAGGGQYHSGSASGTTSGGGAYGAHYSGGSTGGGAAAGGGGGYHYSPSYSGYPGQVSAAGYSYVR